ncbi:hypothetical protein HGRIS_009229 [Hohenbuehelia grisea]|uniref:Uncharacterized protein n=1 Tax=Hohenbuehelia grisea TaxID=104357 RepID=A0ABR3J0V9_9AGAR
MGLNVPCKASASIDITSNPSSTPDVSDVLETLDDVNKASASINITSNPSSTPDVSDVLETLDDVNKRIYTLLSRIPNSLEDVHVRPSLRREFIKWASRASAYQYIACTCIPDNTCRFRPPRFRYGYKLTHEQALAGNLEFAPEKERVPPVSVYKELCHESVDIVSERTYIAGTWLQHRTEKILEFEHKTNWCWVWENGEEVRMFSFRDTWRFGNPPTGVQVAQISQLIFGKYIEPMWYLDVDDCYWKARY